MINFMVANLIDPSHSKHLKRMLNAQIENSLDLGIKDIVIISNFEYTYMGVSTTLAELNKFCATGSKMFGLLWYMNSNEVEDVIHSHDLDAWYNARFDVPEFKDVGIAQYSNGKYNGGSVFWKPSSFDIVYEVCKEIETGMLQREEPTLNKILKSPEFKDRVTIVNNTFNVGCSGYVKRYERSEKPIKVAHYHPSNRIAWETHALDRNNVGDIGITVRLERIIRKHYPYLAHEVTTKKIEGEITC
jgi:hypothetical protein